MNRKGQRMLGFDVSVYYYDGQGKRQSLAGWSAHGLDWINNLVAGNRAALVQDSGGYPYVYEVAAAEVIPMFSLSQRAALDRRISRKGGSGGWNQTPLAWGGTINDEGIAMCPGDTKLTVEAWDQS